MLHEACNNYTDEDITELVKVFVDRYVRAAVALKPIYHPQLTANFNCQLTYTVIFFIFVVKKFSLMVRYNENFHVFVLKGK